MEVVERFVAGKNGDPARCEDAIVETRHHFAVIDGATDISGRSYDGMSGGRWAMVACAQALLTLADDIDAYAAVASLTRTLADRVDPDLSPAERPSAAVTIFSVTRREIWQIGDVGFAYAGLDPAVGQPRKRIDQIAADFRAAVIAASAPVDLDTEDPGREAVRALVGRQGNLRNTVGPYAYAGIDGRPVPPSLIVVHPLPATITDLIIASDGYPVIHPTLAETEAILATLIARDPWCVAELAGTKGVRRGQISFDDRSYLRLRASSR
ncbi:hypothetical protein GCM10010435_00140 [Winogradskya consettensis]|uniref:Uncharacterized protein n=1 Tax=Winogradskya consettensis TaxID=113560 RepID=A0A919T5B5_9ACTN|nr:hypothetical protein [Actinoplanes consettensis]GIM85504.1 hypothetical protein Aco04nite_96580 [Actinoplanes consettensis]